MRRAIIVMLALLVLVTILAGCRNETQNRIRRSIQDFTNVRMYITLYGLDGTPVFHGLVDGKVTRAEATLAGTNEAASGTYVFWYDERGRYHQSNLPYLVTSYDRGSGAQTP